MRQPAIVMFTASFVILAAKHENPIAAAKVAFAAGMGPLVFGMLRMVLGGAYDQNRMWYLFLGGNDGVVVHLRGMSRVLGVPPLVASGKCSCRQWLAPASLI